MHKNVIHMCIKCTYFNCYQLLNINALRGQNCSKMELFESTCTIETKKILGYIFFNWILPILCLISVGLRTSVKWEPLASSVCGLTVFIHSICLQYASILKNKHVLSIVRVFYLVLISICDTRTINHHNN